MNVAGYPLFHAVIDGLTASVMVFEADVGSEFVCVSGLRFVLDRPGHKVMQRVPVHVGDDQ